MAPSPIKNNLAHRTTNQTIDYLRRGRALRRHADEEVRAVWVATLEMYLAQKTRQAARNMDDAEAELRLRNVDIPLEHLQDKLDTLQAAIADAASRSRKNDEANDEFVTARSALRH